MLCKSTDFETTRLYPKQAMQINQGHIDSTSSELIFTGNIDGRHDRTLEENNKYT